MRAWVIQVVFVFSLYESALSIHTSDKLDFGDTPHQSSLVKNDKRLPIKVTRMVDTITSPSEHVSVSCGPTGCNTTTNNNTVETEVVVRVKTNINLDTSQDKKDVEDVSDVPIVVGYKGSATDETPNEEQFRSYSSVTPEPNDVSSRSDYTPLEPLYTDSPISIGGGYRRLTEPSVLGGYARDGLSSNYPYRYESSNYRPHTNGYPGSSFSTTPTPHGYYEPTNMARIPNNYYDESSPRADIQNGYYDSSSPRTRIPYSYAHISSPKTVEINGISSPLSSPIPELNRRNYDYNGFKDNGDELRIPYFEHTYNKHYFGEEPPPHTVLYPKSNSFNPVEFRNIPKNKWRPNFWNGRSNKYAFNNAESNFVNPYAHNHPIPYSPTYQRGYGNTGCPCREQTINEESTPYAAASVNHHLAIPSKDPGTSIDDKLAPLT